jgi:hypothetical protein
MGKILVAVAVAGAVGGLANAAVSGTGVVLPSLMDVDGATVLRLGVVGNVFVGALAAVVSFGLYGPLSTRPLLSAGAAGAPAGPLVLTLGACVGALLVGFTGGRWLTAEADRQLNRAARAATAEAAAHLVSNLPRSAPGGFRIKASTSAQYRKRALGLLESVQTAGPVEAYEQATQLRRLVQGRTEGEAGENE